VRLIVLLCACLFAITAAAQSYPRGPVRMIVPFPAGGGVDVAGRVLAQALTESVGKPFVIENRGGANGNIGMELVARASADGYTLLFTGAGLVTNPSLYKKVPYDPAKDFEPVSLMALGPNILVAHPSLPAKTLPQMIDLARAKPLAYGTSGTGGTPHLAGELLKLRTGAQLEHVPYKGGGQAIVDVVGGQIPLVFTAIATAQQYVRTGRLVALGVPSAKRSAALPDVPTFEESGLAGFDVTSWVGIFAPAKTPSVVIERLHKELAVVLRTPFVKERYGVLGIEPVGNSPREFFEQVREDLVRWEKVVKAANIKVE